jgi:hypothetical protein
MALARHERADRADGEVGVAKAQRGARRGAFLGRRRTKVRAVDAAWDHGDALARAGGARERVGDGGGNRRDAVDRMAAVKPGREQAVGHVIHPARHHRRARKAAHPRRHRKRARSMEVDHVVAPVAKPASQC